MYKKPIYWPELLVKSTKNSHFYNKYRNSCINFTNLFFAACCLNSVIDWNYLKNFRLIQYNLIRLNNLHGENRFVKFTGSLVLIFQLEFLVYFTKSSVQSTEFLYVSRGVQWNLLNLDFFVFCKIYWTLSETYKRFADWIRFLVKSTKKSKCNNNYQNSCKFYEFFFLHLFWFAFILF